MINIIIFGMLIGFIYSLLNITNMLLTTRYTLTRGFWFGLLANAGTILSQVIWAGLGLAVLRFANLHSNYTPNHAYEAFYIIPGSLVIMFIAYKIFRAPVPKIKHKDKTGLIGAFFTLFVIAMTRPIRIMGYAALFAMFINQIKVFGMGLDVALILCVGLGVFVFWFAFVSLISLFKTKVTPESIHKFSKISAILVFILALLPMLALI